MTIAGDSGSSTKMAFARSSRRASSTPEKRSGQEPLWIFWGWASMANLSAVRAWESHTIHFIWRWQRLTRDAFPYSPGPRTTRGGCRRFWTKALRTYARELRWQFIQHAAKLERPLLLVINGFNECPAEHKEELVKNLEALYLRWPIPIFLTSQHEVALPGNCAAAFCVCATLTTTSGLQYSTPTRQGLSQAMSKSCVSHSGRRTN